MDGVIYSARVGEIEYIKFCGTVRYSHCGGLESHIDQLFDKADFEEVVVDLEEAEILDSTALGLLARVAIELKKITEIQPVVFVKKGELSNILKRVCFDQVFNIISDAKIDTLDDYSELKDVAQDEQEVLRRVIDAHKYLAKVDASNEDMFKDITQALK